MLLPANEVQQAVEQAQTAFPNFHSWEYNNEQNSDYLGFSLWGQFDLVDNESPSLAFPESYFVTFEMGQQQWQGYLTIGQHMYYWSSTNEGDAVLCSTGGCETLDEAIATLKAKLLELFRAFSVI